MKFLFACLCSLTVFTGFSKTYYLTIYYTFKNIETGYDHTNKVKVYVDDTKERESVPKIESVENSVRVELSEGSHDIKIENWVLYKDNWELHNKANSYSFDLINTKTVVMDRNKTMTIVYDLDSGPEITVH
jgi:hypothetical protein